jgi:hypothetical protein
MKVEGSRSQAAYCRGEAADGGTRQASGAAIEGEERADAHQIGR